MRKRRYRAALKPHAWDREWTMVYKAFAYLTSAYVPPTEEVVSMLLGVSDIRSLIGLCRDILLDDDEPDARRAGDLAEIVRAAENGAGDIDAIVSGIGERVRASHGRHVQDMVRYLRDALHRETGGAEVLPLPHVASDLAMRFDLQEADARILVALYVCDMSDLFTDVIGSETDRTVLHILGGMCGIGPVEFSRRTRPGGRLTRLGLVDVTAHREDLSDIQLSAPLAYSFISGNLEELSNGLFCEDRPAHYEVCDFPVPEIELHFVSRALAAGGAVLIMGDPGIGKTEFAYALGASLGLRVREVSTDTSAVSHGPRPRATRTGTRLLMIGLARNFVHDGEVLLIDEADTVIRSATGIFGFLGGGRTGGGSLDKADINTLLDSMTVPSIWITNSADGVPASIMRRFTHVYRFPHPDVHTRRRMLEERLAEHSPAPAPEGLSHIARRYDFTPAAIDRLARIVETADGSGDAPSIEDYLQSASRGPMRADVRPLAAPAASFDPRFCNTSVPPGRLIALLRRRAEGLPADARGHSCRLLFDGPPGGGKTQFALYLAAELGREAMLKRPSDILSPWVGVSEHLVADMFREAEERGAVLILDEADALLADRAGARRSFELTRAAEFLQGIGEFEGILIACTNRIESVDPAVRRRFHRRVTFGPLREEHLRPALAHLFPQVAFTTADIERLRAAPSLMMSDLALAAEMVDVWDDEPDG
ncbi:MAG: AAA family ATPase, partial [Spirochaetaceae bacterium]